MPQRRVKSQKRNVKKQAGILAHNRRVYLDLKVLHEEYTQEFEEVLRELINFNKPKPDLPPTSAPQVGESGLVVHQAQSQEQPSDHNNELAHTTAPVDFEPWAKKLYKKIIVKVHPDKIDLASSFDAVKKFELLKFGSRVGPAVQEKDYPQILEIGVSLECEVEGLTFQQQSIMLVGESKEFQKKISEIQNSLAWHWCENYDNLNIQLQLLEQACQAMGVTGVNRKFLIDFVNSLEIEDNITGVGKCKKRIRRAVGQRPQRR